MVSKVSATRAVVVGFAIALTLTMASPAHAQSDRAAADVSLNAESSTPSDAGIDCVLNNPATPWLQVDTAWSSAFNNCGGTSDLWLMRHRWYGWQRISDIVPVPSGTTRFAGAGCGGTGTYTYRATHAIGATQVRQYRYSNTNRFAC